MTIQSNAIQWVVDGRIQAKAPICSPLPGRCPAPPLESPGHFTPARAPTPQHTPQHQQQTHCRHAVMAASKLQSPASETLVLSSWRPVIPDTDPDPYRTWRKRTERKTRSPLSLHSSPLPPAADTRQVLSLGPYYLATSLCLSIASVSPNTCPPLHFGALLRPTLPVGPHGSRSMTPGGWRTGPRTAVDRQFFSLLFFPSGPPPVSQHPILRACRPARGNGCLCICLFHAPHPPLLPGVLPSEQGPCRLHPHVAALFAAPKRACHMI
jgi:hypothetical protein